MSESAVILITGSSRGLGRCIARMSAEAGHSVAIHYGSRLEAALEVQASCEELRQHDRQRFEVFKADMGIVDERDALVPAVLESFGRIDALVNNAGIAPDRRMDIVEASEASFDRLVSVNLKGPHFFTQQVARWWLQHPGEARLPGGYKLIFITSVSAEMASVQRAEYCISKAALAMAAQLWAARLAREGIQVNELRPGIMETDMTAEVKAQYDPRIADGLVPQMRWGRPEDVGKAVISLMAGDWPFSSGGIFHVDGGLHLPRL